jgi:hypothetical protein
MEVEKKRTRLSDADWEPWKPLIYVTYIVEDKTLDETLAVIQCLGFEATYAPILYDPV